MKTFLKHISLITVGIFISTAIHLVPSGIQAVTASLSTTRVLPFENMYESIRALPASVTQSTEPHDFALPAVNFNERGYPIQFDINGDGLVDMLFSNSSGELGTQYVLINTGRGFEAAYVCNVTRYDSDPSSFNTNYVTEYRGDCADYSQ